MRLKRTQQALAGVALPVLAAHHKGDIGPRTMLAVHACGCGTRIVLNRLASPSCPVCSKTIAMDQTLPAQENELVLTDTEMEELPVVAECKTCSVVLRGSDDTRKVLSGLKCYCPVCTSVITAAEMGEEEVEDEAMGEEMSDEGMDESMEDDTGMEDGTDEEDAGEETILEDGEEEDTGPLESDDAGFADGTEMEGGEEELADEGTGEEDVASEDEVLEDEGAADDEVLASSKGKKRAKRRTIIASPFARFLRDPAGRVDLLASADKTKWFLMVDDKHIATARLEKAAASLREIFPTDKFTLAFQTAAEDGLTEDKAGEFGFDPVNIEVPVDEATEEKVTEAVNTATASLNQQMATVAETFERCIGIAAVGLNKGSFGDKNVLREALVAKLENLRVRHAASVVDSVLAQEGEEFLKAVVAKAVDLTKKTPAVLDEIAVMVAKNPYTAATASANDDRDDSTVVPFMTGAGLSDKSGETTAGTSGSSDMKRLVAGIRGHHLRR